MSLHLLKGCPFRRVGDHDTQDVAAFIADPCETCHAVLTSPAPSKDHDDGRLMWSIVSEERQRARRALHALGFEPTGQVSGLSFGDGPLTDYIEEHEGPLGSLLIEWKSTWEGTSC